MECEVSWLRITDGYAFKPTSFINESAIDIPDNEMKIILEKVGSLSALAKFTGLSMTTIHRWKVKYFNEYKPAEKLQRPMPDNFLLIYKKCKMIPYRLCKYYKASAETVLRWIDELNACTK